MSFQIIENGPPTAGKPGSHSTGRRSVKRRQRLAQAPAFQFVTATEPSQFKDPEIQRSVRAQVMLSHLKKQEHKKASFEVYNSGVMQSKGTQILVKQEELKKQGSQRACHAMAVDLVNGEDAVESIDYAPLEKDTRAENEKSDALADTYFKDYENTDYHEARQLEGMYRVYRIVYNAVTQGDGFDPFQVLPRFPDKSIDTVTLIRRCNRTFTAVSTTERYMPMLLEQPRNFLSALAVATAYTDYCDRVSGDSKRTTLLKAQVIRWLNERISDPTTQTSEVLIMMILHLLVGEAFASKDDVFRIHCAGLEKIVKQRGGMKTLRQVVAEVLVCVALETHVFAGNAPSAMLLDYVPPRSSPLPTTEVVPESPLYRPYHSFYILPASSNCSARTYQLICDMESMTGVFLATYDPNFPRADHAYPTPSTDASQQEALLSFRDQVSMLPSVRDEEAGQRDWTYECCRLAALIYSDALSRQVPFTSAAERLLPDLGSSRSVYLPSHLYEALQNTSVSDCWGDVSGLYYWACLVGASASRHTDAPEAHDEAMRIWVRRCFNIYCARARSVAMFKHPSPVIAALRRFHQVLRVLTRNYEDV